MRALPILVCTALAAAPAFTGCGTDEGEESDAQLTIEGTVEERAEIPGEADPEEVRVIDEWSRTLREGDVEGAAGYFEVPSIAQNGTPPLPLASREEVIAFNEALPCGAILTRAEMKGRFTIATFELTERPGPGECGTGTGRPAKTAFVIRGGLIVEWRRAPVDTAPPAEGPVV